MSFKIKYFLNDRKNSKTINTKSYLNNYGRTGGTGREEGSDGTLQFAT